MTLRFFVGNVILFVWINIQFNNCQTWSVTNCRNRRNQKHFHQIIAIYFKSITPCCYSATTRGLLTILEQVAFSICHRVVRELICFHWKCSVEYKYILWLRRAYTHIFHLFLVTVDFPIKLHQNVMTSLFVTRYFFNDLKQGNRFVILLCIWKTGKIRIISVPSYQYRRQSVLVDDKKKNHVVYITDCKYLQTNLQQLQIFSVFKKTLKL